MLHSEECDRDTLNRNMIIDQTEFMLQRCSHNTRQNLSQLSMHTTWPNLQNIWYKGSPSAQSSVPNSKRLKEVGNEQGIPSPEQLGAHEQARSAVPRLAPSGRAEGLSRASCTMQGLLAALVHRKLRTPHSRLEFGLPTSISVYAAAVGHLRRVKTSE